MVVRCYALLTRCLQLFEPLIPNTGNLLDSGTRTGPVLSSTDCHDLTNLFAVSQDFAAVFRLFIMYSNGRHSRPHVSIPPGSQQSLIPASPFSPYAFELSTPAADQQQHISNLWDNSDQLHVPGAFEPRPHSMLRSRSSSPGRASTVSEAWEPPIAFPEPQLYRSSSQRTPLYPGNTSMLSHRHSRSVLGGDGPPLRREESRLSLASSYDQPDDSDHYETASAGVRVYSCNKYFPPEYGCSPTATLIARLNNFLICRTCPLTSDELYLKLQGQIGLGGRTAEVSSWGITRK